MPYTTFDCNSASPSIVPSFFWNLASNKSTEKNIYPLALANTEIHVRLTACIT